MNPTTAIERVSDAARAALDSIDECGWSKNHNRHPAFSELSAAISVIPGITTREEFRVQDFLNGTPWLEQAKVSVPEGEPGKYLWTLWKRLTMFIGRDGLDKDEQTEMWCQITQLVNIANFAKRPAA